MRSGLASARFAAQFPVCFRLECFRLGVGGFFSGQSVFSGAFRPRASVNFYTENRVVRFQWDPGIAQI